VLETILGNHNAYLCLLYIYHYGEAYPNMIATALNEKTMTPIKGQLRRLEGGGILKGRKVGRTTMYSFNEKHIIVRLLKEMVKAEYDSILPGDKEKLFAMRSRPRREGKPVLNEN
jgi:hypothetical protein